MNSRKPIYHKDDPSFRIASFPGGQWQFQRHDGTKGTNRRLVDGKEAPHNDPWHGEKRVTSYAIARRQLDSCLAPKGLSQAA